MKVTAFIRSELIAKHNSKPVSIYFRLRDSLRHYDFKARSELKIIPSHWSDGNQGYKHKISVIPAIDQAKLNIAVRELKNIIESTYEENTATQKWLVDTIHDFHHPSKGIMEISNTEATTHETANDNTSNVFDMFIMKQDVSDARIARYHVLRRALLRFEAYTILHMRYDSSFKFKVKDFTPDLLELFWDFLQNENIYAKKYPEIYDIAPENKIPKEKRGANTIVALFKVLRAFIHWCEKNDIPTAHPFNKYKIKAETYGTPYYLSIQERDTILTLDLTKRPALAVQRDIFIFQCLIGCRVTDLYHMTRNNVVDDGIEYIAEKTKGKDPRTIRVPLNSKAKQILDRYKDIESGGKLFPFIAQQKYNLAIKKVLMLAGITRPVTVMDPKTGESVTKPLNEIASSHIARRTFVGNLYKQVKDPNLVGALSGHTEGSRAFTRYRTIDEDMKKELVSLLE